MDTRHIDRHWANQYELSVRAKNTLINNYPTEAGLRAQGSDALSGIPNCGCVTRKEIDEVLGLGLNHSGRYNITKYRNQHARALRAADEARESRPEREQLLAALGDMF